MHPFAFTMIVEELHNKEMFTYAHPNSQQQTINED
jgi:hypothetical protein